MVFRTKAYPGCTHICGHTITQDRRTVINGIYGLLSVVKRPLCSKCTRLKVGQHESSSKRHHNAHIGACVLACGRAGMWACVRACEPIYGVHTLPVSLTVIWVRLRIMTSFHAGPLPRASRFPGGGGGYSFSVAFSTILLHSKQFFVGRGTRGGGGV